VLIPFKFLSRESMKAFVAALSFLFVYLQHWVGKFSWNDIYLLPTKKQKMSMLSLPQFFSCPHNEALQEQINSYTPLLTFDEPICMLLGPEKRYSSVVKGWLTSFKAGKPRYCFNMHTIMLQPATYRTPYISFVPNRRFRTSCPAFLPILNQTLKYCAASR